MPVTKRIVVLDKSADGNRSFNVCYRFDVPAAYQPLFRGRATAFKGGSEAERAEVDSGAVYEVVSAETFDAALTLTQIQTELENNWTALNSQVQATRFADITDPFQRYGRFWNGTVWAAGASAPPAAERTLRQIDAPCFAVVTPVSSFVTSKFHLVLFLASTVPPGVVLRLRTLVVLPDPTVSAGAVTGPWTLRRRLAPTTAPAGGNTLVVVAADPADSIPAGLSAFNAPATAPAGGTAQDWSVVFPPGEELKAATLDVPSLASVQPLGGLLVYDAALSPGARPLSIRANSTLELQQNGTAGVGNCRVLAHFTVE